jgi:hypothetical protein
MKKIKIWYNKNDFKDEIHGKRNEQPPEGYTQAVPLSNIAYQKYDEETGKWVHDQEKEIRTQMITERDSILDQVAKRDYRAWKAVKLNKPIDELYPGESDWYKAIMERFTELEIALGGEV